MAFLLSLRRYSGFLERWLKIRSDDNLSSVLSSGNEASVFLDFSYFYFYQRGRKYLVTYYYDLLSTYCNLLNILLLYRIISCRIVLFLVVPLITILYLLKK